MAVLLLTNLVFFRSRCEVVTLCTWPPSKRRIVYVQPTMYRPEVSRSAQSRSHTMAYTYRTRAQKPQLRARQSTNSALRQESNRRGTLVFWHNCVRVALSFRQTVDMWRRNHPAVNTRHACLIFWGDDILRGGKGGWEIEKPTTTEQKCPCTSTNKKRSETRKGNWNLSISKKKRKKERNSETGKGLGTVRKKPRNRKRSARAALSVASRSKTRLHISMVILESVWFWRHGVLSRHFCRSLCTIFLLQLFQALWTEFFSSAKG